MEFFRLVVSNDEGYVVGLDPLTGTVPSPFKKFRRPFGDPGFARGIATFVEFELPAD